MRFSTLRLQFAQRSLIFLSLRGAIMPEQFVLHEANALSFDRVRDHARRATCLERNSRECSFYLVKVVAVNLSRGPAERTPFRGERFQVHNFLDGTEALDLVVVDNSDQIVQFMLGSEQYWLPGRPFIAFTIAQQHKDPMCS